MTIDPDPARWLYDRERVASQRRYRSRWYSATNHGVTKSATQVLNYLAATVTPTNLFLNDTSNPLKVQMGQTSSACVIVPGQSRWLSGEPGITLAVSSTPDLRRHRQLRHRPAALPPTVDGTAT